MRKIIFIVNFLLLSVSSFAQFSLGQSVGQQYVENAVRTGLFLTKHSFRICDEKSGDLFGLDGKDEFGSQYAFGVKVPGGILLTNRSVCPWLYDVNFEKYKDDYSPVLFQALYSGLEETPKYDLLDYEYDKKEVVVDTAVYRFMSSTFDGKGFTLDNTTGKKDGWIIWVVAHENSNSESNVQLDFLVYRKEITVNKNGQWIEVDKPDGKQKILGGIYVVPTFKEVGIIEFQLCGVLAQANTSWRIYCPFIGKSESKIEQIDNQQSSEAELTPIGKSKKGKAKNKKSRK